MGRRQYWIQKAITKEGGLRRQLGIPQEKSIPSSTLKKIIKAQTWKVAKIDGLKKITPKLKKRATLALTLRRFKRRR
jgi:predicted transcriptional regulator